jgi:dTDP-glucose 4,6-dehydratase
MHVRDWLFVTDNCRAIDLVLQHGNPGEIFNIGGGQERTNREITGGILEILDKPESLIKREKDRPGHDRRYSLDFTKVAALGYEPRTDFKKMLEETVRWYVDNRAWWEPLKR